MDYPNVFTIFFFSFFFNDDVKFNALKNAQVKVWAQGMLLASGIQFLFFTFLNGDLDKLLLLTPFLHL